jgi:hypothetical protein
MSNIFIPLEQGLESPQDLQHDNSNIFQPYESIVQFRILAIAVVMC